MLIQIKAWKLIFVPMHSAVIMMNVLWSIQALRDQDNHDSALMSLPTTPSSKGVKIPGLELSLSQWTTHTQTGGKNIPVKYNPVMRVSSMYTTHSPPSSQIVEV